jgi:hypothetical protein
MAQNREADQLSCVILALASSANDLAAKGRELPLELKQAAQGFDRRMRAITTTFTTEHRDRDSGGADNQQHELPEGLVGIASFQS